MSEYVSKKALLEWLKKRLDETQFVREAHALAEVVAKIECGRFDDDQTEARRLRAIEQAIRDFQPTKEQRAGYDALVAWLESTTTFVLDPNGLTN